MRTYIVELEDDVAREVQTGLSLDDSLGLGNSKLNTALFALKKAVKADPPPAPRIDQPTVYGVVEGSFRSDGPTNKFVHTQFGWISAETGAVYAWDSIKNPVLIRAGI